MRMNTEIMKRLDMMEKGDVKSVIDSLVGKNLSILRAFQKFG